MAILSRNDILAEMATGGINFSPQIDGFQLQPHAIDLRLGYRFLIPKNWHTHPQEGRQAIKTSIDGESTHKEQYEEITLSPGQYFELTPNEFVIATSLERIELNNDELMAILFPRTSTNRRGIDLSLSGIIDVHYKGELIFPMKNVAGNQVIRVYPGERICQVIFERLTSPVSEEDAQMHGLAKAKYTDTDGLYRLDKEEERDLIVSGNIEKMKAEFPVAIDGELKTP